MNTMMRTRHLGELISALAAEPADREVTYRAPFQVGLLVAGAFADAIAYGRSLGLNIDVHKGGGLFVRRVHVTAQGRTADLCQFLALVARIQAGSRRP